MYKRVLLCYDGTESARRALRRGAELAILVDAEVHILSIVPTGVMNPLVAAGAVGSSCLIDPNSAHQRLADEAVEWLRQRGKASQAIVATGDTVDVIELYAKRLGIDLIVLGHYPLSRGGFWWTNARKDSLADRVSCCILVAIDSND